jgi:hypothetical protein
MPVGTWGFFSFLNCPDQLWGPMQSPIQQVLGSFPGVSSQGMMLTTHLQIVLRLSMSGAIPLLPVCAFMAWRGATSQFPYFAFIYNFLKYQTAKELKTF